MGPKSVPRRYITTASTPIFCRASRRRVRRSKARTVEFEVVTTREQPCNGPSRCRFCISSHLASRRAGAGGSSDGNGGSNPPPVATVTIAPAELALTISQTQQLTATTRDAGGNTLTGRSISWSTSDAAIATVSASGLVTAVAAGSATITATSEGQTGSASVTVAGGYSRSNRHRLPGHAHTFDRCDTAVDRDDP